MSKISVGDLDWMSIERVEKFLLMIGACANTTDELKQGVGYVSRSTGLGISSLLNTVAKTLECNNWGELLNIAERKSNGNRDLYIKSQCFVTITTRGFINEFQLFSESVTDKVASYELTSDEGFKYICESILTLIELSEARDPLRMKQSGFKLSGVLASNQISTMIKQILKKRKLDASQPHVEQIAGYML